MAYTRARTFDLDLLRTFAAVRETGGFTAAARQMNSTQSTVSMQIRRLEEQVGTTLFQRLGRSVQATPDGERLAPYAGQLLSLNDLAWNDLTSAELSGRVRLGIPDDFAFYLPEVIRAFREQYPAVDLQVTCDLSITLMNRLAADQLDLAIVTRHPRTPGGHLLRREKLVWVAAPDHQPERLDPLPLSLFPRDICVFRERALDALNEAGRPWQVIYTSMSLSGQQAIVGAGLAVTALIPSMISPQLRQLGEDSGLPDLPNVEIALHRRSGRPSEAVKRLSEMVETRLSMPA
ncbi:LysR substrate-binding domain-containing protein [Rhodovibrio salinarum]|uniref:Transcriptional regulator n=1 Tax=Rhodovibrio salinarum TaxID=1087 RepID=A0A934QKX7_9PROT|nr:LysR substrate-binding domain-containing protein [Rhodovibrio salinarum]MBK1698642.1 transcriptional regulator [Rhodovibrio salinarum]